MTEEQKAARAKEIEDAVKKADAAKKDAAELETRRKDQDANVGEKLDMLLSHLDDVTKRLDAIEKRTKKADSTIPDPDTDTDAVGDDDDDDDGLSGLVGQERIDAKNKQFSALSDAQSRCDSVASAFGVSAPRFMDGETTIEYRRRLARPYQRYSQEFKDVDLTKIKDRTTLAAVEGRIYADALAASSHPIVDEGRLEARTRKDSAGREITTFYGQPRAWMKQFSGHTMALTGVKTQFDQGR